MALTPQSFLRSPMLLVAILISAGMALVGGTLFLAVAFTCGEKVEHTVVEPAGPAAQFMGAGCDHVLRANGSTLSSWSADEWVGFTSCFESVQDHDRAAAAAAHGLSYHPGSESLHNMRGYNLIVLERYEEAVVAIRVALQSVEPTNGTLHNNLAWAGLFASEQMALSEARRQYRSALELEASCETFHTGMWVEYGLASKSSGQSRDEAIEQYDILRERYEPCTRRLEGGDRMIGYEVAGAGILDAEIHKLTMIQFFEKNEIEGLTGFAPLRSRLVQRSLPAMGVVRGGSVSAGSFGWIASACDDIAPIRSAVPACRKALTAALAR